MGVVTAVEELQEAVRDAGVVVPVGGRTQWEIGNPVMATAVDRRDVRAPEGIVAYEPADLTVTVRAGSASR